MTELLVVTNQVGQTNSTIAAQSENVVKSIQLSTVTLSVAVEQFLNDVISGQSSATARTYRFVLRRFYHYLSTAIRIENGIVTLVSTITTVNPSGLPSSVITSTPVTPNINNPGDKGIDDTNEINDAVTSTNIVEPFQPDTFPVAKLQTSWAISFMRLLANGQLPPPPSQTQPKNSTIEEVTANNTALPTKTMVSTPSPKSTIATFAAALLRFYRWCSVEQLLVIPSDEFERLSIRLRELRGKQRRTIIDKVPANDIVEALLYQARKNITSVASTTSSSNYTNSDDGIEPNNKGRTPTHPLPISTKIDNANTPTATTTINTSDTNAINSNNQSVIRIETDAINAEGEGIGQEIAVKIGRGGYSEYDQMRQTLIALRNLALLETLKSTGARVSEVCSLKQGDLDATNRRARVVGKGNKERWIYFSSPAWEAIQTYIRTRTKLLSNARASRNIVGGGDIISSSSSKNGKISNSNKNKNIRLKAGEIAAEPVFARHDRRAGLKTVKLLTPRSIQATLWELVEQADLVAHITPHKFRHWFATRMLSATGDLAVTQDLLGHANPATTRIYAQVSETKKQDAHRSVFE